MFLCTLYIYTCIQFILYYRSCYIGMSALLQGRYNLSIENLVNIFNLINNTLVILCHETQYIQIYNL